ncbi:endonuclease, partial [Streptomyces benahoarensis]
ADSAHRDAAPAPDATDAARGRLARAQEGLLAALVAGAPPPEGFDPVRLEVQRRALAAKRATVIAKVAPELPEILGDGYRPAFLAYARGRPLTDGHRRDALDFAAHLLARGLPDDAGARARLTRWWQDRAGPRPPGTGPLARLSRSPLFSRLLRAVRPAAHRR